MEAVKLPAASPLCAIREEADLCVRTAKEFGAGEDRAVGEGLIVGVEELFCESRTGDDNGGGGAEAEENDGPVRTCEAGEVSVQVFPRLHKVG